MRAFSSAPAWAAFGAAVALPTPGTGTVSFVPASTSTGDRAIYETVTPTRISGVGGVPADATAVVLSATIRKPTLTRFLTVYLAGFLRPDVSNVNFLANANLTNATLGDGGAIDALLQRRARRRPARRLRREPDARRQRDPAHERLAAVRARHADDGQRRAHRARRRQRQHHDERLRHHRRNARHIGQRRLRLRRRHRQLRRRGRRPRCGRQRDAALGHHRRRRDRALGPPL